VAMMVLRSNCASWPAAESQAWCSARPGSFCTRDLFLGGVGARVWPAEEGFRAGEIGKEERERGGGVNS
jgi:hypothetical protein